MYLVTGATGMLGRSLVDQLLAAGHRVRAVTRDPAAAGRPAGAEVVAGDPGTPETLRAALTGVTGLFLHPRAAGPAAPELLAIAKESGVGRVVVLSATNVDDEFALQPSRFAGDRNKEVETAAVESGLDWVSLRSAAFAVNTLSAWGGQIRAGDVVRGPYADFAETPIHERDLAAVAVRALAGDDLLGRKPDLTGPESLTHAELIETIGRVTGRPMRFEEVPARAARQAMIDQGLPAAFVDGLMTRYERGAGRPAPVSGEVQRVLGRPALTWARWIADHPEPFAREDQGSTGRTLPR